MQDIRNFIKSMKTEQNSSLIEAILAGEKAIFEDGALQRFNQNASEIASNYGNNVLSFIQHSSEQLSSMFSSDEDFEDDIGTRCSVADPDAIRFARTSATCTVPEYVPDVRNDFEQKVGYSFNNEPINTGKRFTAKLPIDVTVEPSYVKPAPQPIDDKNSTFSLSFA